MVAMTAENQPLPRPRRVLPALLIPGPAAMIAFLVLSLTAFKNSTAGLVTWWMALVLSVVWSVVYSMMLVRYRRVRAAPEALGESVPVVCFVYALILLLNAAPERVGLSHDAADIIGCILMLGMLAWFGALFIWWYRDLRKKAEGEIEAYKRKQGNH
jgi:hypothetical protein